MKELYKFRQYLTEGKLVKEDVSSRFINKYLSMVTPEDFKDIEDIESYSDRDKAIFKYLEIGPGIMVGDELARDLKDKPGEEIVGYFKDKNYSYMPYSAMDKTFGSQTPTGMEFERGQPDKVHLDRTHNMRINKILRSEYPEVIDFIKSDRTGYKYDVHNAIQDRYSDEAKDGRSREVSYEEYASDFADAIMDRAKGNLNENEEQGYTLYDTKVEYDNGKTGYMFQLVNSEDREENEIGFDQLFFDDEDNRLEMGVDFNSFDQGSYQEGEVSAEEAMKMYKSLAEGKLNENASGKVLVDKVEPRWIIADPSNINMKGVSGGRNSTITYYKRESSAQKELDYKINNTKITGVDTFPDEYKKAIASAEVIEVEMQVKIVVK